MHDYIELVGLSRQESHVARLNARAQGRAQAYDRALLRSEVGPAVAKDSTPAYYGVELSKNIARSPNGYLICKDAVIGRTGKQRYLVSQLHSGQLQDLGLFGKFRANDVVDVWRDPEEVFSETALASFEDMPVTDNHPMNFVSADNHRNLARGHVRNIRQGDSALASGDLPLLGDLIITDKDLADAVVSRRKRQLSCGYGYKLAYDGERLSQVDITGNHVAVVSKGRAGEEARINDAAPDDHVARLNERARRRSAGFNE